MSDIGIAGNSKGDEQHNDENACYILLPITLLGGLAQRGIEEIVMHGGNGVRTRCLLRPAC